MSCEWVVVDDYEKYLKEVPPNIQMNHHVIIREQWDKMTQTCTANVKNNFPAVVTINGADINVAVQRLFEGQR